MTNIDDDLTPAQHVSLAILLLREARDLLVYAQAPKAAAKVRRALKSAEGAHRNAEARPYRQLARDVEEAEKC
jgi:hypothetical protein